MNRDPTSPAAVPAGLISVLLAGGVGWIEGGFVGGLTWRWETVYRASER
jgi:Flp pilus assembly pilin Flp